MAQAKSYRVADDGYRLSDELWAQMEPLLPPRPSHPLGCHNPPKPARQVMDAIVFVLQCSRRSGSRGFWPMTGWTGRWARPPSVGKNRPNPTDRAKRGTERSLLTDARGTPLSVVVANVNDHKLMDETLQAIPVERPQPTPDQPQHLCLDKGYDD